MPAWHGPYGDHAGMPTIRFGGKPNHHRQQCKKCGCRPGFKHVYTTCWGWFCPGCDDPTRPVLETESMGAVGDHVVGTSTRCSTASLEAVRQSLMASCPPGQKRSLSPECEAEQEVRRLCEAADAKQKLERLYSNFSVSVCVCNLAVDVQHRLLLVPVLFCPLP